ncbi:ycf20-like protein [Cucumis sativus]|uniref:Ycf20-like protein n=1 Tax=Cucumis sativus TaxID=3659 RepID=A0A0A0K9U0_CUCSA|nr:ycf20-like protein [Cucumis sativus]
MATSMRLLSTYPRTSKLQSPNYPRTRVSVPGLVACFYDTYVLHGHLHHQCCSFYVTKPSVLKNFKKMALSIRGSVEGNPFDPPSSNSNGRTRLIRIIQAIQTKLNARINELRKNLPLKILFFLVGFYSATAFATVIGQTGDWDILSAALAVVVVEGIGALMYRASLPLLNKIKDLITMFNYWKAGLSMGLFLDSFKFEMDDIFGLHNLFHLYLHNVIPIIY